MKAQLAALALLLLANLGLQAGAATQQAATYYVTFTGSGTGEPCEGTWNVTGQVTVNLTVEDGEAVAVVGGRLRYDLQPSSSQLAMCVEILLSREGLAPGFKVRFPANATYPTAPIYYTPGGPVEYESPKVRAHATPGPGLLASQAKVEFTGSQTSYTLTLQLASQESTTSVGGQENMGGASRRLYSPLTLAAVAVTLLTLSVAILRRRRVL